MNLPRLALISAPMLVAAWLVEPAVSYACGGYPCAYDQFLPREGAVPANIPAIAWSPGFDVRAGSGAAPLLPHFECAAADGSSHSIRFEALPQDKPDHLQLSEKLIPGEHCVISSGITDCSVDDPDYKAGAGTQGAISYLAGRAELDVVDEVALPESLGVIAVTGARIGDVDVQADASCSENIEVCIVDTSIDWSSDALAWQNALSFDTLVDGKPFSTTRNLSVPNELGGLYGGRDRDVVFSPLGALPKNVNLGPQQLEAGEHSVQIRASLPGSDLTLATPPVTVVLRCGVAGDEPPLAESMISGDSGGCTVAHGVGSSQRHTGAFGVFGLAGLLLAAARRRRRLTRRSHQRIA